MRLFYPEPDSLTVFGPDNTSYSLMLLVRSEAIYQGKWLYFLVVSIEVLALVFGYALHIRGFVISWRLRAIHLNFVIVTAGMYSVMIGGAIGRLVTIPYEMRVVQFAGLYERPIPYLAVLRQASYVHAFLVLWVWAIERTFATIYVADYEKRERLHIAIILNVVFIPCSYAIAYSAVARICNMFIGTFISLVPTLLCAMLLRYLIRYNERRLARITHRIERHPDEYSLSLRVQLKENIWSMRKIEFGVYLLVGGLAMNLVIIFAPVLLLTAPDQFELLQWLTCVGNLSFAIFIFFSSPWLEVAIAMHTGQVPLMMRVFLRKDYYYKQEPLPKNEIDSYFDQLDNQWSAGYDRQGPRKNAKIG